MHIFVIAIQPAPSLFLQRLLVCLSAQHLLPKIILVYIVVCLSGLVNSKKGEERANKIGVATMMMKCEGLSSVMSFGKCAANEIAVLNQLNVIECCFENLCMSLCLDRRLNRHGVTLQNACCVL